MFQIKANPLRVGTTVFTAVIVLLMLVLKFVPGDYHVPLSESLSEKVYANPVSLIELKELILQTDRDFLLVDIRTPEEYEAGHLPDAVNIPLKKIFDKKSKRKLKKQINIIYCSTESMAHAASYLLNQCGYHCRPVNGSYQVIKEHIIDKFDPTFSFYSEEKQQYNYPAFIKQTDAPQEFKIDKKTEIRIQSGC